MPKVSSAHSMNAAGAVIDGRPVIGLWDGDDAITVTPVSDEGDLLIGADGSAVFSNFIDDAVTIEVMLQPSSPTHTQLLNRTKLQNVGLPTPFPISVFNLGGGESGSGTQCFIMRKPDKSLGKNATVRKWTLICCDWRDD